MTPPGCPLCPRHLTSLSQVAQTNLDLFILHNYDDYVQSINQFAYNQAGQANVGADSRRQHGQDDKVDAAQVEQLLHLDSADRRNLALIELARQAKLDYQVIFAVQGDQEDQEDRPEDEEQQQQGIHLVRRRARGRRRTNANSSSANTSSKPTASSKVSGGGDHRDETRRREMNCKFWTLFTVVSAELVVVVVSRVFRVDVIFDDAAYAKGAAISWRRRVCLAAKACLSLCGRRRRRRPPRGFNFFPPRHSKPETRRRRRPQRRRLSIRCRERR